MSSQGVSLSGLCCTLQLLQTGFPAVSEFIHGCTFTCLVVGGVCGCPSPSLALLSGQCIVTFITIWCVGDKFTSLSASQVSADSSMCCNRQLHRKVTLVIVQHHILGAIAVTMYCICPVQKCSMFQTVPLKGGASAHQTPTTSALFDLHTRISTETLKR